ncbi:hypothetical protein D9611_010562 [Ephemerocybe angulata]|uniref:Uncharacterized protein n=1 Tax=Ephemerocybe angulata TaxID=980116 RepID=A0A8H5BW75_9AGAR|nr:hypothetical protein D9611_010562 [Tulosesus angulatus]
MEGRRRKTKGLNGTGLHKGLAFGVFKDHGMDAIVTGPNWLQGPDVYSAYHEQYGYPERTIAFLFVTGFLTAVLAAALVGVWADQQCVVSPRYATNATDINSPACSGRRKLCLDFCITYTLAYGCITMLFLSILLLGNFLCISTSIVFSASWLVSSSALHKCPQPSSPLPWAAPCSPTGWSQQQPGSSWGVTGSFVPPFITSAGLLGLAWVVISGTWAENWGSGGGQADTNTGEFCDAVRNGYFFVTFMISMMLGPGSHAHTILAALLTRSSASQANEAQELLQVTCL